MTVKDLALALSKGLTKKVNPMTKEDLVLALENNGKGMPSQRANEVANTLYGILESIHIPNADTTIQVVQIGT